MSVWGKLLGGAAGFAIGGPLGAILGAVAGHAVDRMRKGRNRPQTAAERQIAFTAAVVVLGAKMAKADGRVTRDEVSAFKRVFRIPESESVDVGRLFNEARTDAKGFEPYARQIADLLAHQPAVLEELLEGLFLVAKADGMLHQAEVEFLRQVAHIFGLSSVEFERILTRHSSGDHADPFEILGIPPHASDTEVKTAYRQQTRENHPDRLVAQGLPKEFIDLATAKMATINTAYDRICKSRGMT